MISYRKKICLIGDFAVGKTSLVKRYVDNIFAEDYMTTVGVSIVTKEVQFDQHARVKFVIWDIAGADKLTTVSRSYLAGANGYVLVADGTRTDTIESALALKAAIDNALSQPKSIQLLNKHDLIDDWKIDANTHAHLHAGMKWQLTSAKSGEGVEQAFISLARRFLDDVR